MTSQNKMAQALIVWTMAFEKLSTREKVTTDRLLISIQYHHSQVAEHHPFPTLRPRTRRCQARKKVTIYQLNPMVFPGIHLDQDISGQTCYLAAIPQDLLVLVVDDRIFKGSVR